MVYVHINVCVHVHVRKCVCAPMYTYANVCVYVGTPHPSVRTHGCVRLHIRTHTHACVHVQCDIICTHTLAYMCDVIYYVLTLTHTFKCTHLYFRRGFFSWAGKPLAVFSGSAAAIDLILLKIFKEFEAGKKVVKIDMVVLPLEISGECFHNSSP